MMTRLIWIAGILSVLYGGYWFVGRSGVQGGATQVLTQLADDGWVVSYDELSTSGFPSRFDTTLSNFALSDPINAIGWAGPWLQVFALSYRPTEVIALLPPQQSITVGGESFRLETNDMRASAAVRATPSLPFDRATIDIEAPRLTGPDDAWQITAGRILLAARDTRAHTNTYDFFAQAEALVLPAQTRRFLDPDDTLPPLIRLAKIDGNVALSLPIDRFSADQVVELTGVSLRELALGWGDLEFNASGNIAVDANGFASGDVQLSLRNWDDILAMLVRAGVVDEGMVFTVAAVAENMDATPDNSDLLTLEVTLQNGRMIVGGFPIGEAPRLR